jgi:hypothetical protein
MNHLGQKTSLLPLILINTFKEGNMEDDRFEIKIFDHYLSAEVPVEIVYSRTFKKALEKAIEIMKIDLSADTITIYDLDKDKPRADLNWNKNEGLIEARSLKDGTQILASGDRPEILAYYLRR